MPARTRSGAALRPYHENMAVSPHPTAGGQPMPCRRLLALSDVSAPAPAPQRRHCEARTVPLAPASPHGRSHGAGCPSSIVPTDHAFPQRPLSRPLPLSRRTLPLIGVATAVAQILLIYLTASLAHPELSHGAPGSPIFKAVQQNRYKALYRALQKSPTAPECVVAAGSEQSHSTQSVGTL